MTQTPPSEGFFIAHLLIMMYYTPCNHTPMELMMREIGISGEQLDAFARLADHVASKSSDVMRFNGPGGTGKTFVLRHLIRFLELQGFSSAVVAFTGRAASQLAKDGVTANTCHSLLYNPIFDENDILIGWELKSLDEILASCGDCLILDEGSMLPREMYEVFRKLPIPKIFAGDRKQLPSVAPKEYEFNAMEDVPGDIVSLTINHRFSESNGIGFIANHLRENDSFPRVRKESLSYIRKSSIFNIQYHIENQHDIIICGMNKTRKTINDLVRRARGYESPTPIAGERVVCLQNTIIKDQGRINNGELFTVEAVFPGKVVSRYILISEDGRDRFTVNVKNDCWKTEKMERKFGTQAIVPMTFGYCLSCHKVQGSTFGDVLFVDEDVSFFLNRQKFRYTGTTRAANMLTVAT